MKELWMGEIVGILHNNGIPMKQLAKHLGVCPAYISMIINGKNVPKNAEQRIRRAITELISQKTDLSQRERSIL